MDTNLTFPKPDNDSSFEDLVCDIYARKYHNPNLQRYGRRGQRQDGLDIRGFSAGVDKVRNKLIGVQCKHHPETPHDDRARKSLKDLILKELNDDIARCDKSGLKIDEYIFTTSAQNDNDIQDIVIEISEHRQQNNLFSVEIQFWDNICKDLENHSDILYKYIGSKLPREKLDNLTYPDLNEQSRQTSFYNWSDISNKDKLLEIKQVIKVQISEELRLDIVQPYIINLSFVKGIKTFSNMVDLEIDCKELVTGEDNQTGKSLNLIKTVKALANILDSKFIDKKLIIYSDLEITPMFTIGFLLRKLGFEPKFVFQDKLFSADHNDIPVVPHEIYESGIEVHDIKGTHNVLILEACGLSERIEQVKSLAINDLTNTRLVRSLRSNKILSSAHAYAVSKELIGRLHNLELTSGCSDIHLFLIAPKPLAALIGYLVNTLRTNIHLYFLDNSRNKYIKAITINNNTHNL